VERGGGAAATPRPWQSRSTRASVTANRAPAARRKNAREA
jgi:hypothetical protein